jgi:predicted AlkP superfamily phosphohydrolase/phosphomutase
LNTFLVKNGYMNLKSNVLGMPMELDDLTSGKSPFDSVDWERTQAYGLGLGMGFLNILGREPQGAVTPEQAKAVGASLAAALKSYVDPHTGMHPIREVYLRDDIYSGYDETITPDFRIATAPPYRISWDTTLGGMPAEITDINDRTWSGDHCSLAPEDVMGILFTSRPIAAQTVEMADMCPSMLSVLGVTTTETLDGKSIFAP